MDVSLKNSFHYGDFLFYFNEHNENIDILLRMNSKILSRINQLRFQLLLRNYENIESSM